MCGPPNYQTCGRCLCVIGDMESFCKKCIAEMKAEKELKKKNKR